MDLDRVIKFIEAYVRDYAIYVFGVLASSPQKLRLRNMRATGTKLWSYAIISVALGNYVFNGAISPNPEEYELGLFAFIRTMWFWFLIAVGVFLLMKMLRAAENLLDTMTVALKVLPVAFVVAAFAALTAASVLPFFFQVAGAKGLPVSTIVINMAKVAFLATQFVVITRYFVLHLRPRLPLTPLQKILIRTTVPLALLIVNAIILLWPAQAAAQATDASPSSASSQQSCPLPWPLRWLCNDHEGGGPLGMDNVIGAAPPEPPPQPEPQPVVVPEPPVWEHAPPEPDPAAGDAPPTEASDQID